MKKSKTTAKTYSRPSSRKRVVSKAKRSRLDMALHKRIMLHPISIFFLLCIGVFMAGMTIYSYADSFVVTAKVSAPLPTSPASITSPADQTHVSTPQITVSGTCPADSYVNLYREGTLSGTVVCGSVDTTYAIDIVLQPGSNALYTRIFNLTDDEGPQSATVTVWYDVPPVPQSTAHPSVPASSSSPTTSSVAQALGIVSEDYHYQVYKSGELITWNIHITGGSPPYSLTIDWGDGSTTTTAHNDETSFEISHSYLPTTIGNTPYAIKLEASDAQGAKALLQLATVVKLTKTPISGGVLTDNGGSMPKWLPIVWSSYSVVVLMTISFWLGERQEIFTIFHHSGPKPRAHKRT